MFDASSTPNRLRIIVASLVRGQHWIRLKSRFGGAAQRPLANPSLLGGGVGEKKRRRRRSPTLCPRTFRTDNVRIVLQSEPCPADR